MKQTTKLGTWIRMFHDDAPIPSATVPEPEIIKETGKITKK